MLQLALAWGFVGIPLAWGVLQTLSNALKLFQWTGFHRPPLRRAWTEFPTWIAALDAERGVIAIGSFGRWEGLSPTGISAADLNRIPPSQQAGYPATLYRSYTLRRHRKVCRCYRHDRTTDQSTSSPKARETSKPPRLPGAAGAQGFFWRLEGTMYFFGLPEGPRRRRPSSDVGHLSRRISPLARSPIPLVKNA